MAIRLSKENGHVQYSSYAFVADYATDVASLPTNTKLVCPGSTCFVIETSKSYILNTQGVWSEYSTGGGGGGGGGSEYPSADNISFPKNYDHPVYLKTDGENYDAIVNAINGVAGTSSSYTPSQMAGAITALVWEGTQAEYDLIDPKNPTTLYIIVEEEEEEPEV